MTRFLEAFAAVLCTAGAAALLFRWIRQPVVLGYIVAGMLLGPHLPIPPYADPAIVRTLSELGVIFLMFALGLEFSLRRLVQVGPSAATTAVVQVSLMLALGYIAGHLLGWDARTSFFGGAVVAISSTTIIARAFDEQGIGGRLRELVVGVLLVEDLIAVLLLAVLTTVTSGAAVTVETMTAAAVRLALFLVVLLALGVLIVPRLIALVRRLHSDETTLVVSLGICVGLALLAHELGYSVALGAFVAGSLIAESGGARDIEALVHPVRDLFAAVFFVSVGMLIDPALLVAHWPAIALFAALVLVGKTVGTAAGAFLAGNGPRLSVRAGMSLAQIGEFSFIIAAMAMPLGGTAALLYPIAVSVSAITTMTTPLLIRGSERAAAAVDRRLPAPLQTFATLYASWLEQLRGAPAGTGAAARRLGKRLLGDTVALALVISAAALWSGPVVQRLQADMAVPSGAARALVAGVALLLAAPFALGIFRVARRLGLTLAESVLPRSGAGRLDLAAAPRRSLVLTLQLTVILLVALVVFAVTQPFLPFAAGLLAISLVLATSGVAFWHSATDLHGHVRAGTQAIVEALSSRTVRADTAPEPLNAVRPLLPGLGSLISLELADSDPAVGLTLADLDLRGRTGATILVIIHQEGHVVVPTPREQLRAGDVLALTGSTEAVAAAITALKTRTA